MLEAAGVPLGVVGAIAGQSRARIAFTGEAGHAGTVPMALRRDALCAAAEFVSAVEAVARAQDGARRDGRGARGAGRREQRDPRPRRPQPRRPPRRRLGAGVRRLLSCFERAGAIAGARAMTARVGRRAGDPRGRLFAELTELVAEAVAAGGHPVVRAAERRRPRRRHALGDRSDRDAVRPLRRRRQPPPGRVRDRRGRRRGDRRVDASSSSSSDELRPPRPRRNRGRRRRGSDDSTSAWPTG